MQENACQCVGQCLRTRASLITDGSVFECPKGNEFVSRRCCLSHACIHAHGREHMHRARSPRLCVSLSSLAARTVSVSHRQIVKLTHQNDKSIFLLPSFSSSECSRSWRAFSKSPLDHESWPHQDSEWYYIAIGQQGAVETCGVQTHHTDCKGQKDGREDAVPLPKAASPGIASGATVSLDWQWLEE